MFRRFLLILALAVAGLVIAACFLAAATSFDTVRGYLDKLAGDGSAEPYTPQLHARLRVYFVCLGIGGLSAIGWLTVDVRRRREGESLLSRLLDDGRRFGADVGARLSEHQGALIVLVLCGLLSRAPYLGQPIRYDEAHSFVNYADRPAYVTVSTYKEPNNHVFHNLCVHVVTRLLGDVEWTIRLTTLIAGLLTIPATYLIGYAFGDRAVGWASALAVAASSPLIEYSANARGYTLLCLVTLCLILLGRYNLRRQNVAVWWMMSVLAAVGFWTVPTMLYPFALVLIWICLQKLTLDGDQVDWLRLVVFVVGTIGLTIAFYSPILIVEGPAALVNNRYIAAPEWPEFWDRLPATLLVTGQLLFRDLSLPAVLLIGAGCLLALRDVKGIRRSAPLLLLSCSVCGLIVLVQHVLPPSRTWLFLLPIVLTVATWGLIPTLSSGRPGFRRAMLLVIGLLLVVDPLVRLVRDDSIRQSKETGNCPDAEAAIVWLKSGLLPREPIVTIVPSSAPLVYYAQRHELSLEHFEWPGGPHTRDDVAVVMVNTAWDPDETVDNVLTALDLDVSFGAGRFETVHVLPSAELVRVRPSESPE